MPNQHRRVTRRCACGCGIFYPRLADIRKGMGRFRSRACANLAKARVKGHPGRLAPPGTVIRQGLPESGGPLRITFNPSKEMVAEIKRLGEDKLLHARQGGFDHRRGKDCFIGELLWKKAKRKKSRSRKGEVVL